MNLPERLKEERERLGLSQTAFAALAGASKHAQINWEKGSASPNAAALEAWAAQGLDVLYVVTGQRAGGVKPAPTLTTDEEELLALFRAAPLAVKAAAIGALHGAAGTSKASTSRSPRAKAASATTVSQTNHGGLNIGAMHGHVVQGDVINGVPVAGKTTRGRRGAS